MNTVIAFIIIFGALVFFHELGHLVFAKRAGMLCREFAIGFGPKVFSFRSNETLYTIRLLPLGGFVRVAGEDPELVEIKPGYNIGLVFGHNDKVTKIIVNNKTKYPNAKVIEVEQIDLVHKLSISGFEQDDDGLQTFQIDERAMLVVDDQETQIAPYNRQFASKTVPQRAMQIFAGPMMNFILALVLFVILGTLVGTPVKEPILGELTSDGSAIESGLKQGDRVLSIDNQEIVNWEEMVKIIQQNGDQELLFSIERGGQQLEIPVTPKVRDGEKIGFIGVYPSVEKSVLGSVTYGFEQTYFWTKQILVGLSQLIVGQFSIDDLSGPVGIYSLTDEVAQTGIYNLMRWASILSINLGIVNLLPLPALDGGRLIFIGIEAVRGKPVDPQKEGIVHFIGFALLMLLMLVVTWNDIQRYFL
ncbi:RIP metalloprotease RseP [Schinkia azotoformans MEV2011]|uniref:Zinc metalloprotease n=2 Tax=Schinkia azotoformans TaxID=1454 RepID=K6D765_SCHAZ|nr:RIP metalloprotease RseP [Schinkia azotoformans]EKN63918.1 RIP metalloprotease RseP (Zinc) [Schinkia azotoformans LMG 9581]KEF39912.1 RIP metalloprotease RseP [Schinkia azotoformans MEV2011]MEC1638218.1 RIP metalloprotease RseP [Schinkia azotoformans]MEC1697211.1 RIP metalloprotease RseP [Schinkia azotoformans]MEC1715256.1 RIP metalloprotease RseP [Schinkia azotoformans]